VVGNVLELKALNKAPLTVIKDVGDHSILPLFKF
jgi:hypothetical protein